MARGCNYFGTDIRVTDMSLNVSRNGIYESSVDSGASIRAVPGTYKISGSVGGIYRSEVGSVIQTYLFGNLTEGATGTQSVSMYDDEVGYTISNCLMTSFELSGSKDNFVKFKSEFVGRTGSGTSSAGSYLGDISEPMVAYKTTIGDIKCKAFSIKVARKADEDNYIIGDEYLQKVSVGGPAEISGSITLGSSESTQLITALSGANSSIATPWTLVVSMSDKEGNSSTSFTLNNIIFNEGSLSVSNRNPFDKTVGIIGYVNLNTDVALA